MLYRRKKIDYTVPSGHEGGPGMGKQITPYFGTPYLNMTLAQWQAAARRRPVLAAAEPALAARDAGAPGALDRRRPRRRRSGRRTT